MGDPLGVFGISAESLEPREKSKSKFKTLKHEGH
jgi:hypothetical protein